MKANNKEELLKHYGVKGMEWGKTKDKVKEELEGTDAGEAIEEIEEDIENAKQDRFEKKFKKDVEKFNKELKKKVSEISENIKRTGVMVLKAIFGESKNTKEKTTFVNRKSD